MSSSGAGSFSMYESGTTIGMIESLNGSNGIAFKTPSTARMILMITPESHFLIMTDDISNTIFGKKCGIKFRCR